jgi:hypothetical protein
MAYVVQSYGKKADKCLKDILTCCYGSRGCVNDGGVEMRLAEGCCHTSSDTQHFPEGVFIAMSNL